MLKAAMLVLCLSVSVGGLVAASQTTATQSKSAAKAPPKVTLPPAIDAAFKKAYPNATIKHVSKEKENGTEVYEVESVDGTQARDLIYKADGTVVEYEEQVPESSVPAAVITAVKTRYPKATISRCEKLFKDGTTNYELALKGAKVGEVTLTPEGKWISPK